LKFGRANGHARAATYTGAVPRPLANIQAEIALLESAVSALTTGAQSYSINGRQVTKANLGELHKRLEFLYGQVDAQSGDYNTFVPASVVGLGCGDISSDGTVR
jgi:hypothetical protein